METCLLHPKYGYYTKSQPVFGKEGDFTTAPETSQVFGEMIGVFAGSYLQKQSEKFRIVELGPGKGTLAKDVLRIIGKIPNVRERLIDCVMIERSAQMQIYQKEALKDVSLRFIQSITDFPFQTGEDSSSDPINLVIANEFFDALPVNLLKVTTYFFLSC